MENIPAKRRKGADPVKVAAVRQTYGFIYKEIRVVNRVRVVIYTVSAPSLHSHSYDVTVRLHNRVWIGVECTCGSHIPQCKHQVAVCEDLNEDPPNDCPKCAFGHLRLVAGRNYDTLRCTDCDYATAAYDSNEFPEFSEAA